MEVRGRSSLGIALSPVLQLWTPLGFLPSLARVRVTHGPGQVLNVHQHGILLCVQLVSDEQQLDQLFVQAWSKDKGPFKNG